MKIAISGKSGCGNSTVTRLVAERLGFRWVNYTFKNIAAERGISPEDLGAMAEKDGSWDRLLDTTQVKMAREGNVVLGSRLAIWLLEDADFAVYLEAPLKVRSRRIQRRNLSQGRQPTDFESVFEQTAERDRRDHDRYLKLYGIDNDDFALADLVVDTVDLTLDQEVELIVSAISDIPRIS